MAIVIRAEFVWAAVCGLVKRVNSRFPNLERPVFIFELNYSGGQNKRAAKFNLTALYFSRI